MPVGHKPSAWLPNEPHWQTYLPRIQRPRCWGWWPLVLPSANVAPQRALTAGRRWYLSAGRWVPGCARHPFWSRCPWVHGLMPICRPTPLLPQRHIDCQISLTTVSVPATAFSGAESIVVSAGFFPLLSSLCHHPSWRPGGLTRQRKEIFQRFVAWPNALTGL